MPRLAISLIRWPNFEKIKNGTSKNDVSAGGLRLLGAAQFAFEVAFGWGVLLPLLAWSLAFTCSCSVCFGEDEDARENRVLLKAGQEW